MASRLLRTSNLALANAVKKVYKPLFHCVLNLFYQIRLLHKHANITRIYWKQTQIQLIEIRLSFQELCHSRRYWDSEQNHNAEKNSGKIQWNLFELPWNLKYDCWTCAILYFFFYLRISMPFQKLNSVDVMPFQCCQAAALGRNWCNMFERFLVKLAYLWILKLSILIRIVKATTILSTLSRRSNEMELPSKVNLCGYLVATNFQIEFQFF